MRLAEVKDGLVVNVIIVTPGDVPEWCASWPQADEAGPGWTYDGETFSPPEDQPEA